MAKLRREANVLATVGVVEGKTITAANVMEDFLWPTCCSEPAPRVISFNLHCSPLAGLTLVLMETRKLRPRRSDVSSERVGIIIGHKLPLHFYIVDDSVFTLFIEYLISH